MKVGQQVISANAFLEYLDRLQSIVSTNRAINRQNFESEMERYKAQNAANLEQYKAQHEANLEMFRSVIAAGQTALKWAILINGAASVALLAFLGNIWGKESQSDVIGSLPYVLLSYVLGVLSGAIAAGATYLTQWFYSCEWKRLGDVSRVITIVLVICAYGFFLYGGWEAYVVFHAQFMPID